MSDIVYIRQKVHYFLPCNIDKLTIDTLVSHVITNNLNIYVNFKPKLYQKILELVPAISSANICYEWYDFIFTNYSHKLIFLDTFEMLKDYNETNENGCTMFKLKVQDIMHEERKRKFHAKNYVDDFNMINNAFKKKDIHLKPYVVQKIIDTLILSNISKDFINNSILEFYKYDCVHLIDKMRVYYFDYSLPDIEAVYEKLEEKYPDLHVFNLNDPRIVQTINQVFINSNSDLILFHTKIQPLFIGRDWGKEEREYLEDTYFDFFAKNKHISILHTISRDIENEKTSKHNFVKSCVCEYDNRQTTISKIQQIIFKEFDLNKIYKTIDKDSEELIRGRIIGLIKEKDANLCPIPLNNSDAEDSLYSYPLPLNPQINYGDAKNYLYSNHLQEFKKSDRDIKLQEEYNAAKLKREQEDEERRVQDQEFWKVRMEEIRIQKEKDAKEHEEKKLQIEKQREELNLIVPGIAGFCNIGNTCYMNATLQCLNNVPLFMNGIRNANAKCGVINAIRTYFTDKRVTDINEEYNKVKDDPEFRKEFHAYCTDNNITPYLKQIFDTIWLDTCCKIYPRSFKNVLGHINVLFEGHEQHDSCELLDTLLNKVHEENKIKVVDNFYEYSLADEYYLNYLSQHQDDDKSYIDYKKENINSFLTAEYKQSVNKIMKADGASFIVNDFTGVYILLIQCDECKNLTYRFDPFTILTLEFNEECKTINDCFYLFSKVEKLDEDNKYACNICKKNTIATKQTKIWTMSKVLIVQFKRFCYDKELQRPYKKDDLLTFPINDLTLEGLPFHDSSLNTRYNLTSVCSHYGRYGFGHYVSACKNSVNNKWYSYDDAIVKYIPEDKVVETIVDKTAYVLFYTITECI